LRRDSGNLRASVCLNRIFVGLIRASVFAAIESQKDFPKQIGPHVICVRDNCVKVIHNRVAKREWKNALVKRFG